MNSAIGRTNDFHKAMEAAKFASVRGKFAFSKNHLPIQNLYLAEVKRDASGGLYNAYKELIVENLVDPYVGECRMP